MQFCPQCGGPLALQDVPGDPKQRLVCQRCSYIFYLDPKVAVCTIPTIGGKVIMVKRAIHPGYGLWIYPGGYMDRGETVQQAAVRETREEVGLDVRLKDLVGIYSYPTSIVVVIVYACEVTGGELAIDAESSEVRAFSADEIPWDQLAFPSTTDALRDFFKMRRDQAQ